MPCDFLSAGFFLLETLVDRYPLRSKAGTSFFLTNPPPLAPSRIVPSSSGLFRGRNRSWVTISSSKRVRNAVQIDRDSATNCARHERLPIYRAMARRFWAMARAWTLRTARAAQSSRRASECAQARSRRNCSS